MALTAGNGMLSQLKSPPALMEWLFFLILVGVTFVAYKFSSEVLGALSIMCLASACTTRRRKLFFTWRTVSILWLISLLITTDVAVRSGKGLSVQYVPIFQPGLNGLQVQRAESRGLIENRDFVVYDRWSVPMPSKKAVLITIPSESPIRTPTLWFLGRWL